MEVQAISPTVVHRRPIQIDAGGLDNSGKLRGIQIVPRRIQSVLTNQLLVEFLQLFRTPGSVPLAPFLGANPQDGLTCLGAAVDGLALGADGIMTPALRIAVAGLEVLELGVRACMAVAVLWARTKTGLLERLDGIRSLAPKLGIVGIDFGKADVLCHDSCYQKLSKTSARASFEIQ